MGNNFYLPIFLFIFVIMKIKIIISLDVSEKRLLKLGFKKKNFIWNKKPKDVYVIGRHMNDCGSFDDTITYDPIEKEIEANYGGNFYIPYIAKVKSMYDIKKFLKEHSHKDDEKTYGNRKTRNGFDVILKHPGQARIQVMKLLKDELNLSLTECKEFVNSTPKLIKNYSESEEAMKLMKKFEDLGALIELE